MEGVDEPVRKNMEMHDDETTYVSGTLESLADIIRSRGVKEGTAKVEFNQDYVGRTKLQIEFEYEEEEPEDDT